MRFRQRCKHGSKICVVFGFAVFGFLCVAVAPLNGKGRSTSLTTARAHGSLRQHRDIQVDAKLEPWKVAKMHNFTFYIPKSCTPEEEVGFVWSTLLNHEWRSSDSHIASAFALISHTCAFENSLIPYLDLGRLIVVDRRPTQMWLRYKKNTAGKDLSRVRYAVANCRKPYFQTEKDICLIHEPKNTACEPDDFTSPKKFHATFKGTTYFKSRGTHRYLLKLLEDRDSGVVVLTTYRQISNDRQIPLDSLITRPRLEEEEREAKNYSYCDILNSTYAFVPSGRSPASYRLMETLLAGAIPVPFLEQDDVDTELPFSNIIDWGGCLAQNTELPQIHRVISENVKQQTTRRESCAAILDEFLETTEKRTETVLHSMYEQVAESRM